MDPAPILSAVAPAALLARPATVAGTPSVGRPELGESAGGRIAGLAASRTWLVRAAAAGLIVMGAVVLAGWFLNVPSLESLAPGWATMKVNTSIGLIAGGGVLAVMESSQGRLTVFVGRGLATLLLVLGLLSLAENLLPLDLGIDNLIVPAHTPAGSLTRPGLMSPVAALSFAFLGAALLNVRSRNVTRARLAQWLTVPPLLIATLGLFGYIAGVDSLYQMIPYASLAAHTTIGILVLAAGILGVDPRFGVPAIVLSDTAGGFVARRLLSSLPPAFFLGIIPLT
jgi:hypothetical protein